MARSCRLARISQCVAMEKIKRNWLLIPGTLFVFLGFLYFLKLAVDAGWFPPEVRIASGLVISASLGTLAMLMLQKGRARTAEILAGSSAGAAYAVIVYAGLLESQVWRPEVSILAVLAVSSVVYSLSLRFAYRTLAFVATIGALLTPVVLRSPAESLWLLFAYCLVINLMALGLSLVRGWLELRVVAFFGSLVLYAAYYWQVRPNEWLEPYFYVSSFFLVYAGATLLSSLRSNDSETAIADLYIGLINAIHFVFWSVFIMRRADIGYALPLLVVGLLFALNGIVLRKQSSAHKATGPTYFGLALLLIAVTGPELGRFFSTPGVGHVTSVSLWSAMIACAFVYGEKRDLKIASYLAVAAWMLVTLFWYSVAWDVQWVRWFGLTYIPFLNPGALVWIGLAAIGFNFSLSLPNFSERRAGAEQRRLKSIALFVALAAHAVVGGLFTVQIQNVWTAYEIKGHFLPLTLSVSWTLYAMSLYLWGIYSRTQLFRYVGAAVVIVVSLKVLFFDLQGSATAARAAYLIAIGALMLLTAYLNQRWPQTTAEPQRNLDGNKSAAIEPPESGQLGPATNGTQR